LKKPIKVGIVVSEFPPTGLGGTEIATQKIASLLAQRNLDVHIITRNVRFMRKGKNYTLKKVENYKGYQIHRVSCSTRPIFRFLTQFIFGLITLLRIKPDIIHGQQITQSGLIAVVAGKLLRKKSIVWARGSEIYDSSQFYRRSIGQFIISHASVVLAISTHMKNFMGNIWPHKQISTLHNGIDLKNYYRDPSPKSTIELLFIGRLVRIKRVSDAIRSLLPFKDKIPKVMLTIIGSGPREQFLKKMSNKIGVQDHVRFMGKISHDKIPRNLAVADIFIFPSQREGLPLAVLEAMASSLPILASKSTGITELVQDQINGLLHTPGNINELIENLRKLIQNKVLREEMGKASKEIVQFFGWEKIINQLLFFYLNM